MCNCASQYYPYRPQTKKQTHKHIKSLQAAAAKMLPNAATALQKDIALLQQHYRNCF